MSAPPVSFADPLSPIGAIPTLHPPSPTPGPSSRVTPPRPEIINFTEDQVLERGEVLSFPSDIGLSMGALLKKHNCIVTDSGAEEVR